MTQLYFDFLTDDLYVGPVGENRLTESLLEETAQRLREKFRIFLGEWALNTLEGVPYFRDVFVKNPNMSTVQGVFTRVLSDDPAVASVTQMRVELDPATRKLSVVFSATLTDGTVLDGAL